MHKLKWVIPGVLAGGHHPLLNDEFNLVSSPDWYSGRGIQAVISVFETPLSHNILKLLPWKYSFEPTNDGDPPEHLYKICQNISTNDGTFVHCFAGTGRTATVLAAYLLFGGYTNTAKKAILKLRKDYSPNAIHTPEQYLELLSFNDEHKSQDEINDDINQLFKKSRRYTGKRKYEKLLDLSKREMELIKARFGEASPEYETSQNNSKKLEKTYNLFKP